MNRARSAYVSATLLACTALMGGCSDGTRLEQSCSGNTVPNCLPYEYSIVQQAELEPPGLDVDDASQMAEVLVVMDTCGKDAPRPHEVAVRARTESMVGLGDAGARPSIFNLVTLRDDGNTHGDAEAKDGRIDVTIPNPFVGTEVPSGTEVMLRFEPLAPAQCEGGECFGGTCRGESKSIPYTTG
jgi:hypothetical protein